MQSDKSRATILAHQPSYDFVKQIRWNVLNKYNISVTVGGKDDRHLDTPWWLVLYQNDTVIDSYVFCSFVQYYKRQGNGFTCTDAKKEEKEGKVEEFKFNFGAPLSIKYDFLV